MQVVSSDNGKVTRSILHMAENEIPVIDAASLINRVEYLRGYEMSLSAVEVEGFSS